MEQRNKKSNDGIYFLFGIYFIIASIISVVILSLFLSYRHGNRIICTTPEKKTVLGQETRPAEPDLVENEGGVVKVDPVIVIVGDNTYSYDVFLYSRQSKKDNPVSVENAWQVSDTFNIIMKSFFNLADAIANREFIIGLRYDENDLITDQNIRLPENSIKLIYKKEANDQWEIIKETIVDTENNTATMINNRGGYYGLVAGWWQPPTPTPYPWATLFAKANRLYPTKIPLPTMPPTEIPPPTLYVPVYVTVIPTQNQSQATAQPVYSSNTVKCHTENDYDKDILDLILDDLSKAFGIDI